MKQILLILLFFISFNSFAQQDSISTISVSLGQDSFFGFYASAFGTHAVGKKTSLTFYTNYWTNPAFGNATAGTDFFTEVGGGVNFSMMQGRLSVNPALGFTYGKVLSGGEKGVLGDGILPGIFINYYGSKIELSTGSVWFKALRKEGVGNVDYLWIWFTPGYKINSRFTAGLLVEDFYQTRKGDDSAKNLYLWIGPYLQYTLPKGVMMKAAGGYDAVNDYFIKISTVIPLGL